jgi:uncharacterized membrane protein HdeD (DUF308 family)
VALILGAAVGLVNAKLTGIIMGSDVSVQKVMMVYMLHIVICVAYLAVVLLASRLLEADSTYTLLSGATGLVLTSIIMAAANKKK